MKNNIKKYGLLSFDLIVTHCWRWGWVSYVFIADSGPLYYNWTAGVRIRTNLGQIEDWAQRNGFEEEFAQVSEKLLTAAEFLSTSKSLLLKVSNIWSWNSRITQHSLWFFLYTKTCSLKLFYFNDRFFDRTSNVTCVYWHYCMLQ